MSGNRDDVDDLVELANSDPERGLRHALDVAEGDRSAAVRSGALRAAGIANRNLGDLRKARACLAAAVVAADEADDDRLRSLALMSDALILSKLGDSAAALDQLERAESGLRGLERAELQFQRALVLNDVPDFPRARSDFTSALAVFRRHGRTVWEGDALLGRGIALGSMGDLGLARSDCARACELFEAADDQVGVGMAIHNGAWVASLGGEAIKAVVEHDRATRVFEEANYPTDLIHADRCEALISVGLYREAIELAAAGAIAQESAGNVLEAADQRMAVARALMKTGETAEARRQAALAVAAFSGQGQRLQALRADCLVASLDLASGSDPAALVERATAIADEHLRASNTEFEGEARLLAARAAIACHQIDSAGTALRAHARRHRPFSQEVERLRLQAQLHRIGGRPDLALRTARRGIRLVQSMQATVGAVEVRAQMSDHLAALREVGAEVLLQAGRVRSALEFIEAAAAAVPAGPGAPTPSRALIEHRALGKAIAEAEHELRDTTKIHRRRRQLEREIRRQRLSAVRSAGTISHELVPQVIARRYAVIGGALWAFDVANGRVVSVDLGPVEDVVQSAHELLFVVRRGMDPTGPDSRVAQLAGRLDQLLGWPGEIEIGDGGCVNIALCEELPMFPLGVLPSMGERVWALAQRSTFARRRRVSRDEHVIVVGGPDLDHARAELDAIRRAHGRTEEIPPAQARCARVIRAMDAATLVHIVAHSAVNEESPMFSSIELLDGPLYLHELESLGRPPRTVILASCSSARSVTVGSASLGFIESLLGAGIDNVVGTALDIPDDEDTVAVMARLHRGPVASSPWRAVSEACADESLTERQRLIAQCLVPAVFNPVRSR